MTEPAVIAPLGTIIEPMERAVVKDAVQSGGLKPKVDGKKNQQQQNRRKPLH